jgi:hypothetical protein
MTPVIKFIALLVLVVVVTILESFWLQSILQHFNVTVGLLVCTAIVIIVDLQLLQLAIVVGVEALAPKALKGLLLLALFATQCYIWIF